MSEPIYCDRCGTDVLPGEDYPITCPECGAEGCADCIDAECPACGAPIDD